jgi:hypothetical protein
MKKEKRFDYLTRDSIMHVLSDEEVAAVSTAQTATQLDDGDEYVDLETLRELVSTAQGKPVAMGHVLPKKAVSDETWLKILVKLRASREHEVTPVT